MGVLEEQHAQHEQRLRQAEKRLDEHMERLDSGDSRMNAIEEKVDLNNAMTERIDKNTTALLGIFNAFEGAAKVGGWVGALVKWVSMFVIAIGVLWWALKTGELPKKL